jgi:alkylated DNA repair dioxygenase AlkB
MVIERVYELRYPEWVTGVTAAAGFQGSLLSCGDEVGFEPLGESVERRRLSDGAWVDLRPGWVRGADELFERLRTGVAWRGERRVMYDRLVDTPRMLAFFDESDPLPDAGLVEAKRLLDEHYRPAFGEPFRTAGLCLYRDGQDSVAWHGDTIGRGRDEDTLVAIICLGAVRPLMLRPRGGGATIRHNLGHGDLIVMGGSCQRTWEHAILKSSRPTGPRISVQFRPRGVR